MVPEAEVLVNALRERFDASARIGVPAHITVLFPFMPSTGVEPSVLRSVRAVVGRARAFEFSLARVGRFPATTYLAPDPPEPFIALTESLFREFPQFPPFAGGFPTVVPHLTVAHGSAADSVLAHAALLAALAAHGPVKARCESLALFENATGLWRQTQVFPLARARGTR
ncbi:MAG: 2'-5' RNA ligase family protein [Burkholderiales bacterium]|nr:2'-5' RNA ligase family protein [Burkholderiales bacterium]